MGYSDIFYLKEERYYSINQRLIKRFLDIFKSETGLNWQSILEKTDIPTDDYRKIFFFLRYTIIMNCPKYIPIFFKILEDCGFDMSSEVIYAMKLIGKNTFNKLDCGLEHFILSSPVIDSVTNKDGNITIFSEEFGNYSFISTRKYLYNNKRALFLIQRYLTEGYCHNISWELMKYLEDASLITSLLPSYFEGEYYHSVVRNSDGLIIDSANNIVIDDETRDYLFKSNDVVETRKENLEERLKEAIKDEDEESIKIDFPQALLLALHKESKKLNV